MFFKVFTIFSMSSVQMLFKLYIIVAWEVGTISNPEKMIFFKDTKFPVGAPRGFDSN